MQSDTQGAVVQSTPKLGRFSQHRQGIYLVPIVAYLLTNKGFHRIDHEEGQITLMGNGQLKNIFTRPSSRKGMLIVLSAINDPSFPVNLMDQGKWACRSVRDITLPPHCADAKHGFMLGNPFLVLVCGTDRIPTCTEQSIRNQRDREIAGWRVGDLDISSLGSESFE